MFVALGLFNDIVTCLMSFLIGSMLNARHSEKLNGNISKQPTNAFYTSHVKLVPKFHSISLKRLLAKHNLGLLQIRIQI